MFTTSGAGLITQHGEGEAKEWGSYGVSKAGLDALVGIYADEKLRWLDDPSWNVTVGCGTDTVVGSLHAVNKELGVTLSSIDIVHNEKNVFIRSFVIGNEKNESREVKLFLSQQFRISESRRGDTGFYDPRVGAIIHYKGHVKFLINAVHDGIQFSDYNIGLFGIEGRARDHVLQSIWVIGRVGAGCGGGAGPGGADRQRASETYRRLRVVLSIWA